MARRNGSFLGKKNTVSVTTAKGVFTLNESLEETALQNFPGVVLLNWSTGSGSLGGINDAARGLRSFSVSASANAGSITYSLASGSLPPGMSINSSGTISGTPSQVGSDTTYNFTIRATSTLKASVFKDRSFSCTVYAPAVVAYGYTGGDQTFSVPSHVTYINVKIWGGAGGQSFGGAGGFAGGTRQVSGGQSYTIRVGGGGGGGCSGQCSGNSNGGGFGGGGAAYEGNGGGGGSYIFYGGTSHGNIVACAGGGGGGGGGSGYNGGAGGGSTGQSGQGAGCQGGYGGTQSSGGSGAPCTNGGSTFSGSAMQGAHTSRSYTGDGYGGGGGGGYYGGGSGNRQGGWQHTAGGGGSGYVGGLTNATNTTGSYTTPGNSGDGDRSGAGQPGGGSGRIVIRY